MPIAFKLGGGVISAPKVGPQFLPPDHAPRGALNLNGPFSGQTPLTVKPEIHCRLSYPQLLGQFLL